MATEFQYDCPHCSTRLAGFRMVGKWTSNYGPKHANLVAVCRVCSGGLLISSYDAEASSHVDVVQHAIVYPGNRYRIIETWPNDTLHAPSHVPDNISNFYRQATENLRSGRWDAAGAMFRKSLDVATKLVEPQYKELTLFKRTKKLVEVGLLTRAMGEWADEIRLDGNDAVHDEEPETQDDAMATQKFAEAFLTYVFSLPEMVAQSRAKRNLIEPV